MNQSILDSLFLEGGFNPDSFPDLFYPITIAALVFLVGTIVLYNVQTRRLKPHPPLLNLNEWLFWTGLAVFGLLRMKKRKTVTERTPYTYTPRTSFTIGKLLSRFRDRH